MGRLSGAGGSWRSGGEPRRSRMDKIDDDDDWDEMEDMIDSGRFPFLRECFAGKKELIGASEQNEANLR